MYHFHILPKHEHKNRNLHMMGSVLPHNWPKLDCRLDKMANYDCELSEAICTLPREFSWQDQV